MCPDQRLELPSKRRPARLFRQRQYEAGRVYLISRVSVSSLCRMCMIST